MIISSVLLNFYPLQKDYVYFRYDLLLSYFVRHNFLDKNLAVVLWPAILLLLYLDYTVHFRRDLYCFLLVRDILIINRKDFCAGNSKINWLTYYGNALLNKDQSELLKKVKLATSQLTYFPQFQHEIRCRAVFYSYAFDLFFALFVVILGLIECFCVYYYYVFVIWPGYSALAGLVILVDGSMVVYSIWHSAKLLIFLIYSLTLVIYVLIARQTVMTGTVRTLIFAPRKKGKKSVRKLLVHFLPGYVRWQLRLIYLLLNANGDIVSPIFLLAMISMLGLNVYATTMLVFQEFAHRGEEPPAGVLKSLYSSCRYLHLAQPVLDKSQLSLKVKLFTMNEVLTTGERFTYTVGPIAKITSNAIFERPNANFGLLHHFIDKNLAIVIWPGILLLLYLDYTVHFRRGLFCFRLVFDLMIDQKEMLAKIKLNTETLTHFPQLHHSIRCRAVFFSYAFDVFITGFVSVVALIDFLCLYYYYLNVIWPGFSAFSGLLITLDGSLVMYSVWHSAKLLIFLIYSLTLVIFVLIARQTVMTDTVRTLISVSKNSKMARLQLAIYLPSYIRWQLRLIYLLLSTNRDIVSPTFFLAMISMFGLNVYATTMLVLKNLPFAEKMILLVLCALQVFFVLLGMRPMIMAIQSLYSSCRYLHRAQPALEKSNAALKIKLLTMHEVLTSREKFAFTVGSMGKITTNAFFESNIIIQ
ncbi:hypothetical protein TYRP_021081 [Tyrophagus putrescentiae]|nr:hypothetical protein TYRP_021081 [Tyrophagus putrescentiae]